MRVIVSYFDWQAADSLDVLIGISLHGNFHGKDHPALYQMMSFLDIDCNDKELCADLIFERFNIGGEIADRFGHDEIRSFSVGDLVMFDDGTALLCKPIGWELIDLPDNCKTDFDGYNFKK